MRERVKVQLQGLNPARACLIGWAIIAHPPGILKQRDKYHIDDQGGDNSRARSVWKIAFRFRFFPPLSPRILTSQG